MRLYFGFSLLCKYLHQVAYGEVAALDGELGRSRPVVDPVAMLGQLGPMRVSQLVAGGRKASLIVV